MKNKSEHENYPVLDKLQHVVFYVNDLEVSQRFYEMIFDVQCSATAHPDSSAAMRLVGNTMKFYSFGHYQHDICLVQNPKVVVDNEQWNHYSLKLANGIRLDEIKRRLEKLRIPYFEGRMLPIFSNEQEKVIHFKDPNGHVIEVVE
ncbi:VOC family protein [Neobacillus sp. SuZ13]|uniref:VOC family protein n=1 Tax=Neobacillus sp. SuZ13 TaxID=3047875 RepID=UPI0024C0AA80|nr:VOC family protein [Neobacillus sp. SuZ13]WHY69827.1 VOC family protein [Neobacillus sp. SuZ13]